MNRLLIGDVGSGKTVVAGIGCYHALKSGQNVALVAPTQILAQQHFETLSQLFPDINIQLVAGNIKPNLKTMPDTPTLFVGTHAVVNKIETIKPAILIFDEQHRFGVSQRSQSIKLSPHPHILTMSATPIPRSLVLTIFSHLQISKIDEMPRGIKPTKTWLVPNKKKDSAWSWIFSQLASSQEPTQALVVCPFIDPSRHQAMENIDATTEIFEEIQKKVKKSTDTSVKSIKTALLHSKLSTANKKILIQQLYSQEIQLLVSTPIVEVGVDLPAANIVAIMSADRFGLASLHQIRGRVGRAGQESYCLLFSNTKSGSSRDRLQKFAQENDGFKLAEQDLQRRGAGDLFGTTQHGFSELIFASWLDLDIIQQAREVYEVIEKEKLEWKPVVADLVAKGRGEDEKEVLPN